jgi:hypothetical protein
LTYLQHVRCPAHLGLEIRDSSSRTGAWNQEI